MALIEVLNYLREDTWDTRIPPDWYVACGEDKAADKILETLKQYMEARQIRK